MSTGYYNDSTLSSYDEYLKDFSNDNLSDALKKKPLDSILDNDKKQNSICDLEVSWYHGLINREKAESILMQGISTYGIADGLFLVRESVTVANDFALSLTCNHKLLHYQIQRQYKGHYHIDNGPIIQGLDMIIERHKSESHGLPVKLKQFCPGNPPPHDCRKVGYTNVLHKAVRSGNLKLVQEILKNKNIPPINTKNEYGTTALHDASFHGYTDIVCCLVSAGADPNARDVNSNTALHVACIRDQPDIVAVLIRNGHCDVQDANLVSGHVPLHDAALHSNIECVKVLLAFNAPLNPRNHRGETPIDLAKTNSLSACRDLMSKFDIPPARAKCGNWYHAGLDRQGAIELLKSHDMPDGLFLIRPSSRQAGWHVLSLCHSGNTFNFEIRYDEYGHRPVYFIDEGPYLTSLEHLVDHYSIRTDGLPCTLKCALSSDGQKTKMVSTPVYPEQFSNYRKSSSSVKQPRSLTINTSNPVPPAQRFESPPVVVSHPPLPEKRNPPLSPAPPPPPVNPPPTRKKEFDIRKEQIILGNILGEGEFGSVYKGTYFKDGKKGNKVTVAIKTFREDQVSARDDFYREVVVMQALDHPCIVKLIGVCNGPPLMMVEEFITKGSLLDFLWDHAKKIDIKTDLYLWAAQIAAGMVYLESMQIVHRDLAARNILLQSKKQVKISDFGLSRAVGADSHYYRASKGGRWPIKWYAPECVNYGQFSHASDVWSYGVTLWEMFSFGEPPYGDMTGVEVLKFIEYNRLKRPEKCPEAVYKIMLWCWATDKHQRPTFLDLREHFLQSDEYASIRDYINTY